MKGRLEISLDTLLLFFSLFGTFLMIVIVYFGVGTTAKVMQENVNKLNAMDAMRVIEGCLTKDGKITEEFLDTNKGKDQCNLCGICETIAQFKVEDVTGKGEWNFNYNIWQYVDQAWKWFTDKVKFWDPESNLHVEKNMLITIHMKNGETHLGRLYVWS